MIMYDAEDFAIMQSMGYVSPEKTYTIDENSGNAVVVKTIAEEDNVRNREIMKKYDDIKEERKFRFSKINEEYQEYGSFIWIIYNTGKLLFDGKINGATLTRVIYLSTYIRYSDSKNKNTIKENNIRWISLMGNDNKPISRSSLSKILNVSDRTIDYFIKETTKNKILYIKNGLVYLNSNYVNKGSNIKVDSTNHDKSSRIYIDTVRTLYKEAPLNTHKLLSYLFLMIPFLNFEWNVLCYNQEEKDINKIERMSLNEFCSIMGYNETHIYSLAKKLIQITIGNERAISVTLFVDDAYVFINPRAFYAGNSHKKIFEMAEFICPTSKKLKINTK